MTLIAEVVERLMVLLIFGSVKQFGEHMERCLYQLRNDFENERIVQFFKSNLETCFVLDFYERYLLPYDPWEQSLNSVEFRNDARALVAISACQNDPSRIPNCPAVLDNLDKAIP